MECQIKLLNLLNIHLLINKAHDVIHATLGSPILMHKPQMGFSA